MPAVNDTNACFRGEVQSVLGEPIECHLSPRFPNHKAAVAKQTRAAPSVPLPVRLIPIPKKAMLLANVEMPQLQRYRPVRQVSTTLRSKSVSGSVRGSSIRTDAIAASRPLPTAMRFLSLIPISAGKPYSSRFMISDG